MTTTGAARSWHRRSLALLVIGLIAAACTVVPGGPDQPPELPVDGSAPPSVDTEQGSGGILRIGLPIDPVSIDPRAVIDATGEMIVDALFDPLVRIDDDGQPQPAAATRWSVSDDGRTFVFRLREAAFHDGTPVTASDFVRTFTMIADGTGVQPSFLAYLLAPVEGFEQAQARGGELTGVVALDEATLQVTLRDPDPGFITVLSNPSLVPIPVAATQDPEAFAAQPIGNGSFAMAGPRETGAFVRLTAFEDHYRPPLLDEVVFTFYLDDVTGERQWQDLLNGQLQVASIGPEHREEAVQRFGRSPDGYQGPGVLDGITVTTYLYGFDVTAPPFDDLRLRRAISLAIDREALAQDVMQGTRVAATALLAPPIPGAQPSTCKWCRHDPRAARALWDEVRAELIAADAAQGDDAAESGVPDAPGDEGGDGSGDGTDGAAGADGAGADGADDATAGADEGTDGDVGADDGTDGGAEAAEDPPTSRDTADEDAGGDEADEVDETNEADEGDDGNAAEPGPDDDGRAPDAILDSIVLTHTRGVTHAAIAESMAADIREALDVNVSFVARDLRRLIDAIRDGDVGLFRFGWEASEADPSGYLRPLFHTENLGGDNLTGYAEAEVDDLLDEARSMELSPQRLRAFRRAERRILDDLPAMPLLWYRHQLVVADDVRDLVVDPFGRLRLDDAWIDGVA